MPRHKTPVDFEPDAKTKSFSTATQEPNQCRSATLKWSHFRQPTQTQINFILHWNQVKFDWPHWNQVNLDHPHKMQGNLHVHTKNKWFSPLVLKPSQFRPPTQQPNQFHPYTEVKSISIPTIKSSQFWRRDTISQLNFDPHTETKPISIPTLK